MALDFEFVHKGGMCTISKRLTEKGDQYQYKIELTRSLDGGYWVECFDTDEEAIKEVKEYLEKGYPNWWGFKEK